MVLKPALMPIQKYKLLTGLSLVCACIVFFQYYSQKSKHDRLDAIGVRTNIVTREYKAMGTNCVSYYFTTKDGQKIVGSEKCGNEYLKYLASTAIYNPNDPHEYELSVHFDNYYPVWRIVFFFFIYLPVMVFVTYGFVKMAIAVYFKFKR